MMKLGFRPLLTRATLIMVMLLGQGCSTEVLSQGANLTQTQTSTDEQSVTKDHVKKESMKSAPQATYVAAEVIVGFVQDVKAQDMEQAITSVQGTVLKTVSKVRNTYLIALPEGVSVPEAIRRLEANKVVLYAQPNQIYKLMGQ